VITLTGDPRRWAAEPGIPGVVRFPDTHRWGSDEPEDVGLALQGLEDVIMYEGPQTIAALILEPVVGTNGILVPPDGYLQGVREICDRHGILLIADEVMSGFGRTGAWWAVDHWGVVPDLITMAKGLTASYLPLGAVGMRRAIAETFRDRVFYGGLTYNSHPMGCAAALATIAVYEEDNLIARARTMGESLARHHADLRERHPSVGAVRSIGMFGIVEVVRSRSPYAPMAPYNGTSDEMKAIGRHLRENGLYTFVRWNGIMTNPPLTITEEELAEGFAIIDAALDKADEAVTG
jgi:taurine---2-oxoglutarate transaminase